MDAKPKELRERVRDALENRIRPRDEVMMIRRLMSLQLGQTLGKDNINNPPSLIDSDVEVSDTRDFRGLQREYAEAVKRNLEARAQFAKVQQEHAEMVVPLNPKKEVDSNILELHLKVMKLQKRHDQLGIVHKYLDQLEKQPAAAPDFLNPENMYRDCSPLPEVPQELVDGFAVDHNAKDVEVEELLHNLRKSVLRSKLLARKQKQQWEKQRAENPIDPKTLSPEARLHALNSVKNTLINWIESQLAKAGDDDGGEDEVESFKATSEKDKFDLDAQLAAIKQEYERHVELRKEIIALLAKKQHFEAISGSESRAGPKVESGPSTRPSPTAHLLIPYVEKLHALGSEQKGLIQEKSHINASLSKQQEDAKMALDHLAQESQLLPRHPPAKKAKPRFSFGSVTRSAGHLNVQTQLEPWIHATDSAKIKTLETVAEKVEEGMLSIEEARGCLEEICKLLNVDLPSETPGEAQEAPEEDLWLPDGADEKAEDAIRSRSSKTERNEPVKTIWSILDGTLGSINE
jgi:hypothetical protein